VISRILAVLFIMLCLHSLMAPQVSADISAGLRAHAERNWPLAIAEFQKDTTADATRFEANWRIGVTYFISGDSDNAVKYLQWAVAENDGHAASQFWIARAYGDLAERASVFSAASLAKASKRAFENAVRLAPENLDARSGLMLFHLKAPGIVGGRTSRALEQAYAIKERDRERGYVSLAIIYRTTGDRAKEIAVYDDMLTEFPENSAGRLQRGDLHRENGDFEAAYKDFQTVAFDEQGTSSGNFRVRLEPTIMATYLLGATASAGKIHIQEGIKALCKFLALGVFDTPLRKTYSQYHLASLLFADGSISQARAFLNAALEGPSDKALQKLIKRLGKTLAAL